MTENEILELAKRSHLIDGRKVVLHDYGLINPSVLWEPVNEMHFRQCLLHYTEEVIRLTKENILKDVTVTSKSGGEVVAVTLTDEDHKVYKVLWTKEKK